MSKDYPWSKWYRQWSSAIRLLAAKEQAESKALRFVLAIFDLLETDKTPEFSEEDDDLSLLIAMIEPQIAQDKLDRENGQKGGRPPGNPGKNPPLNPGYNPPFAETDKNRQDNRQDIDIEKELETDNRQDNRQNLGGLLSAREKEYLISQGCSESEIQDTIADIHDWDGVRNKAKYIQGAIENRRKQTKQTKKQTTSARNFSQRDYSNKDGDIEQRMMDTFRREGYLNNEC